MPISTTSVTGCCHAMNFYNLGGAHGHFTAKDQNQFDDWLINKACSYINIAITNKQQAKTRSYLETAGWETKEVGGLYISTISQTDFYKYRTEILKRKVEQKRIIQEEQRKKREEEKQKLKFASSIPSEKEEKETLDRKDVYWGIVWEYRIRIILRQPNPKQELEHIYRITLPNNWQYNRFHERRNSWALRDYIYRLVKAKRDRYNGRI